MIGAVLGIGIPVVYLTIGYTWSTRMIPKWWELARHEWRHEDIARRSVREQWFFKALIWPGCLAYQAINPDQIIDRHDPQRREKELDQREREIKRLERELGIRE